jgi:hypothetical protein
VIPRTPHISRSSVVKERTARYRLSAISCQPS